MSFREWALILFTLLGQMAVGSFLVLVIVRTYAARKAGVEEADRLSDRALYAIGPVIILAMLGSFLHLGNPLESYKAVTNLGTSWLSREILSVVIFSILGAVYALLQWRKIGSVGLRNIIAWITAIVGLILVYSMSNVYLLPTQPSWNTYATPVTFFTTTLLLGSLALGAAFVANHAYITRKMPECTDIQCNLLRDSLRGIAVLAVILVGIELMVFPLYLSYLAAGSSFAVSSASMLFNEFGVLFTIRLVLAFVGAVIFGVFIYQNALSPGREKVMGNWAYGAFVLVLVAEVLGRYLFYATQMQITV